MSCPSHEEDTGLRCMRPKGHEPPHRVELEWEDEYVSPFRGRPLRVRGEPIPPEIANGPAGDFARFCGETDPTVLAILDAEASADGSE